MFTRKETTIKVPFTIFRGFQVRKKIQLMFRTPNDAVKGKCYVFSGYNKRNKVCLVDLEYNKLEEATFG